MLENIDLSKKIDKETYKKQMSDLSDRLYYVQRSTWTAGIPVIILFEGWDAAGKGTTIHKLTDPIDPRGYKIYPIRASRTYEKKRPWLWRFWLKIPARGEWAIFDRSWYGRVLVERMRKLVPKEDWERAYRDIVDFERTLADDGALIIKFFLHIQKKEQKKRFKKLEADRLTAWRVTEEDWYNHNQYKKWLTIYEEMLERTDSEWGPWTIVEATDRRYTRIKVYETIIQTLEERLGIVPGQIGEEEAAAEPSGPPKVSSPEDQTAPESSPEARPKPIEKAAERTDSQQNAPGDVSEGNAAAAQEKPDDGKAASNPEEEERHA